ncbi:hypothetical protein M8C21_001823 [Ambrosia artemisiifolia]|uniref:PHL domain-containing protein n=1 Tax=Ambrosia artemisiifolia TaxID=4212 RepID=A0AAD5BRS1_AMBAR|nr:hypothetical protein M8C21_001823 [Ambrosia artemisiifolia]
MILSEKRDDGTVAMHYGELDDCDYLASEECLPTLPNTHVADLLAAQFCTLILREGYHVEGDHLQPKPTNTVRSSGDQQNNNASGVLSPNTEMPETVSGQPSNEIAKPTDSGTNNNNTCKNASTCKFTTAADLSGQRVIAASKAAATGVATVIPTKSTKLNATTAAKIISYDACIKSVIPIKCNGTEFKHATIRSYVK